MKIDTHNSLNLRFSLVSEIKRLHVSIKLITLILSIIEFYQLGTPGILRKGKTHMVRLLNKIKEKDTKIE